MPPLPSNLRKELEKAVVRARDMAEEAARAALTTLAVHSSKVNGVAKGKERLVAEIAFLQRRLRHSGSNNAWSTEVRSAT